MRTKEITLSANLISLYLVMNLINSMTPLNLSVLFYCALFGLFWKYFTIKRNLAIQTLRIISNLPSAFLAIPKLIAQMKAQSITGIAILEWFEKQGYPIDNKGTIFLEIIGKGNPAAFMWGFYLCYAFVASYILTYLFYRFFKWQGIFKRIPNF
jgi:hypothetical protein